VVDRQTDHLCLPLLSHRTSVKAQSYPSNLQSPEQLTGPKRANAQCSPTQGCTPIFRNPPCSTTQCKWHRKEEMHGSPGGSGVWTGTPAHLHGTTEPSTRCCLEWTHLEAQGVLMHAGRPRGGRPWARAARDNARRRIPSPPRPHSCSMPGPARRRAKGIGTRV